MPDPARAAGATPHRIPRLTLTAAPEALVLATSLFWAAAVNRAFFAGALPGHGPGFALALAVALVALHFLLLAPLATRRTVKPLLALMIVATAFAAHFTSAYGVYLDPSMLRNALRTDAHEARELLTGSLLPDLLLYGALPLALLWRVRVAPARRWTRALGVRLAAVALALLALLGAVFSVYQPLGSLMRNQRELRYLITPANYLWSLAAVASHEARGAAAPRQSIGLDAAPGPGGALRQRPRVVVLVLGETARAANWGLNGYARQTTPELARLPVINFPDVTACGTNTEVSVPCMFAPVGRRDYDEAAIRGSESLLHVLARAGVAVQWVDNQSGCKGVCDGLPATRVTDLAPPGLCADGRCLDEGLLHGLPALLEAAQGGHGTQLLVLHMLGNHGPSYFRRYPPAFKRYTPACEQDDLSLCTPAEITAAYDNALLYTDHVLARLVRQLQAASAQVDTAMLYVSDHGESLGENGLVLHGLPYAIAPDTQKKVPMVLWLSDGLLAGEGLDRACLERRATQPAAHDHLFHTLLGLTDVRTALHEPAWDLTAGCRRASP